MLMSEISKSWYRMSRPLFNSGVESDEFSLYGQEGFYEILESYIAYDVKLYDKRMTVEPFHIRAIIQQVTADTQGNAINRQILCPIGTLHCGQYVEYGDGIWIVSSLPDSNRIYEKAVLWKCLNTVHFVSPTTSEVVNYPCYMENAMDYSVGTSERTYMKVSTDSRLIYVPYNEETIEVGTDFRFILDKNQNDPAVFKVARVDSISYAVGDEQFDDGMIQWQVQRTQFNEETDSRELMVANYYSPKEGSAAGELTLVDEDNDWKAAIGERKIISIECDSTWSAEYDMPDGITLIEEESRIIFDVSSDRNLVGKYINVTVTSDECGTATAEIQIAGW